MTRILVQRGSSSASSSNPSRSSSLPSSSSASASARAEPQINLYEVVSAVKDEEIGEVQEQVVVDELIESSNSKVVKSDDPSFNIEQNEASTDEIADSEKVGNDDSVGQGELTKCLSGLRILERGAAENEDLSGNSLQNVTGSSHSQPPPPPVPPPKPSASNSSGRRFISGSSNTARIGPSRRGIAWPVVSTRTSPTGSRPSSPRSHVESEGYNSADEQNHCSLSSYNDIVSFCLSNL